ncbi:MAG: hypothetical protein FWE53_01305 [Firmicutes bacterium]|nr:hypothetical protein [Bacillota bacterium]
MIFLIDGSERETDNEKTVEIINEVMTCVGDELGRKNVGASTYNLFSVYLCSDKGGETTLNEVLVESDWSGIKYDFRDYKIMLSDIKGRPALGRGIVELAGIIKKSAEEWRAMGDYVWPPEIFVLASDTSEKENIEAGLKEAQEISAHVKNADISVFKIGESAGELYKKIKGDGYGFGYDGVWCHERCEPYSGNIKMEK